MKTCWFLVSTKKTTTIIQTRLILFGCKIQENLVIMKICFEQLLISRIFFSIIWFSFQICFFEVWGWKGTMYALFANSKYSGFLLFYQRLFKIQHALPSFDISQSEKCWGFSDIRQCLAPCSWIFKRNQIPTQSTPGCHTFQFLG